MTDNELRHLQELKTSVSEDLKSRDLHPYKCILDTDARLRRYVVDVCQNPERHNLDEQLGVKWFFRMRDEGYKWNVKRVRHFIEKWEAFTYVDEEGQHKVKMTPVQVYIFANIYGWAKEDGRRHVRNVTIFIPRKVGKTTMIAGLAAYEMLYGPANGQIYVGANGYKQAKVCFDMLRGIALALDPKDKYFHVNREKMWLNTSKQHTTAEALSDNPSRLDGLNASVVIMDEYSQAKNTESKSGAALKNVLKSSMGTRREPLVIQMTTASNVLNGPFYNELEGITKMLHGETDFDPTTFAVIFRPDAGDDIGSVDTWRKVQPHMGITVLEDNYDAEWQDAQKSAENMLEFKTKLLNIFCQNEQETWIRSDEIAALQELKFDINDGRCWHGSMMCNIGIDLSVKDDMTAITYMLYDKQRREYFSQTDYYLPEQTIQEHRNSALYHQWVEDGYLTAIPGSVVDPHFIASEIIKKAKLRHLDIRHIGYDPYKMQVVVLDLQGYLRSRGMSEKSISEIIQPVSQSIGNFNKGYERITVCVGLKQIHFHRDPITPWCFDNATLMEDHNENHKPVKKTHHLKIDGAISNIMAISQFVKQ